MAHSGLCIYCPKVQLKIVDMASSQETWWTKQDCYYCVVVAEMLLSLLLHLETEDATSFLQGLQALP